MTRLIREMDAGLDGAMERDGYWIESKYNGERWTAELNGGWREMDRLIRMGDWDPFMDNE